MSPMKGSAAASAAGIAFATLVFMAPAIWNGSPLFYWDSVDYVYLPFTWELPVYRTMPYGAFAGIGRLTGSLWAIVIVQALLTAYVLHETFDTFTPGRATRLLAIVAVPLTLLTGVGWTAGEIMPDVFTAPAVLAVIVLAFSRGKLHPLRRLALACILVVATAVHSSHVAVGAGLVVVLAGAYFWLRRRDPGLAPRVALPAAAIVAGIGLIATIHWVTLGRPFVTQPSSVLWLGRLVQDGIAQRFLDDNCKTGHEYKLCAMSGKLPKTANVFLWEWGGAPLQLYGSWEQMAPEASKILSKSLRDYPWLHVKAAVALSVEQLARFKTGDGVENKMEWLLTDTLKRYYPDDRAAWLASHQMAKPGGIDFEAINRFHVPVQAILQILLIAMVVVTLRRGDRMSTMLAALVLVALLGNAFVCGALSNPNDRYQNRIVWLALVALSVGVVRARSGISSRQGYGELSAAGTAPAPRA
jgi:hypothetical protein